MIRLIAFDLDGTLTQPKTPIDDKNRALLEGLSAKYSLLTVSARQSRKIYDQLRQFPIDVIGNYGLEYYRYDGGIGDLIAERDLKYPCDRESVARRVDFLRERHSLTDFSGDGIVFYPSGCVTVALLGTQALRADKLTFDPDRSRRRAIYSEVCDLFPEYNVFIGGASSFDLAPKPYNKYYALDLYCKEKGFSHEEVVSVGDDYGMGGNDESVFLSDFSFIKVDDYRCLEEYLRV